MSEQLPSNEQATTATNEINEMNSNNETQQAAPKPSSKPVLVDDMSRFIIVELPAPATHEQRKQIAERIASVLLLTGEAADEIERLTAGLATANANHERFEREWYLRGDEIEQARRTAEYWKAEHLAGNREIERLQRERDDWKKAAQELDRQRAAGWPAHEPPVRLCNCPPSAADPTKPNCQGMDSANPDVCRAEEGQPPEPLLIPDFLRNQDNLKAERAAQPPPAGLQSISFRPDLPSVELVHRFESLEYAETARAAFASHAQPPTDTLLDAERYRWLRKGNDYEHAGPMVVLCEALHIDSDDRPFWSMAEAALDAAIDEARGAVTKSGRCACEHGVPNDRGCEVHGAQLRAEDETGGSP